MLPRHFRLTHLLPLAVATLHTVDGLIPPLITSRNEILMFRLPKYVARITSYTIRLCFRVYLY